MLIIVTCSQTSSQISIGGSTRTDSTRSSSPASSQTCVELSSSIHKDKAKFDNNMLAEDFSSPPNVHIILSPPGEEILPEIPSPEMKTRSPLASPVKVSLHPIPSSPTRVPQTPSRGTRTRSPVTSPVKIRFEPYLKARATAAATAQFAMRSLWGQMARELNPKAALMASHLIHSINKMFINLSDRPRTFLLTVSQTCQTICYMKVQWHSMPLVS